jgi:hypothetical protein
MMPLSSGLHSALGFSWVCLSTLLLPSGCPLGALWRLGGAGRKQRKEEAISVLTKRLVDAATLCEGG